MMPAHSRVIARRIAIGAKITATRKAENLRLIDLAALTDFSLAKLCRIEHGSEPTRYEDLEKIARALRVPLRSLLVRGVRVAHVPRLDFGYGVLT